MRRCLAGIFLYLISGTAAGAPELVVLNPEPGSSVAGGEPVIAVSVPGGIVSGSLEFKLDGVDVTPRVILSGPLVTYIPSPPLPPGTHNVEVKARTPDGRTLGPVSWSFTVERPKLRRTTIRGEVGLELMYRHPSRPIPYLPLWDNRIHLRVGGTTGWASWEGSVSLTSREEPWLTTEKVEPRQPLNRYRMKIRTRFGELVLGDANPTLSELTLWGKFVRGLHLKARLGPVGVRFIYGWTRRTVPPRIREISPDAWVDARHFVIEGDTLALSPSEGVAWDSSSVIRQERPGTFERKVRAVQLSLGGERFRAGMNLVNIWDDTCSFDVPGPLRTLYRPKHNYAASFFTELSFGRRRTVLSAEVGGTVATDNTFSEISDTTISSYIPRWTERFIKVNASTRTTLDIRSIKANLIPRLYKLGFRSSLGRAFLKVEHYRIPTNYVSLGSPQQRPDLQGWRFRLRSSFLSGQVLLRCGGERYHDNVDGGGPVTTTTSSWNVSLNLSPRTLPEYSPSAQMEFVRQGGRNDARGPMRLWNRTENFSFGLGAKLPTGPLSHRLMLRTGYTNYKDFVDPSAGYETRSLMLWTSLGLPPPFSLEFTAGRTVQRGSERNLKVGLMRVRAMCEPGRWRFTGELGTTSTSDDLGQVDSEKLSLGIGLRYSAGGSTLEFTARLVRFLDEASEERSYTEPLVSLSWRRRW
ncbi:MAG: hypothetical protein DRQ08_03495 [Candidatus Latescibacterota bacterium]|nr:MAG: hypothetical protein DRQ08_03495 [Candidatus Latescibacterota bacterium]